MEYPSYLIHWKYIRKYKQNGKWRYVYATEKTHKDINRNFREAESASKKANYFDKKSSEIAKSKKGNWFAASTLADQNAYGFRQSSEKYKNEANSLISRYSVKTQVQNLSSTVISKGKSFIKKLLP